MKTEGPNWETNFGGPKFMGGPKIYGGTYNLRWNHDWSFKPKIGFPAESLLKIMIKAVPEAKNDSPTLKSVIYDEVEVIHPYYPYNKNTFVQKNVVLE